MEPLPLEITIEAMSREPENSYLLADMRSQEDRERGSIPGAIVLPVQMLEAWCPETDMPVVLVCARGVFSRETAQTLRTRGISASSLIGGYPAWLVYQLRQKEAEETAARSAEVFNQIRPRFMYLTTVTIFPDSELGAEVARGDFAPMSELERFREFRALVAALENPIVVDTRLVTNSISFVAELPADREECLAALDEAIASFSEDDERRLSRRRAMMRTI